MRRAIAAATLILYLVVLFDLTLFRFYQPGASANLVPFRTIALDLHKGGWEMVVNFVGNVVVFLPMGLLVPTLWRGRSPLLRVAVACLTLSTLIESLQFASGRRVADVDDVILNVAGGVLGGLVWIGLGGGHRRSG